MGYKLNCYSNSLSNELVGYAIQPTNSLFFYLEFLHVLFWRKVQSLTQAGQGFVSANDFHNSRQIRSATHARNR